MRYNIELFFSRLRELFYRIRKDPTMVGKYIFGYGFLTLIFIFLYSHQQDLIGFFSPLLDEIKNLFIVKEEIVKIEEVKPIEEPKVKPTSTSISTTTIIIGITITGVVLFGVGAGLIVIGICASSGGWGGS
jgi:hypothetical protein